MATSSAPSGSGSGSTSFNNNNKEKGKGKGGRRQDEVWVHFTQSERDSKVTRLPFVIFVNINIQEEKFLPYKDILQIIVWKLPSFWFENTKRFWKKIKRNTIKKEKDLKDKYIWMNITIP
jgi:hypothetical protein